MIDLGTRFRSGNPLNGSGESNLTTTVGMSGRNCFPLLVVIEELEDITALALIDNPSFSRGWVSRSVSLLNLSFALSTQWLGLDVF
jgi:hypothetical protein